MAEVVANSALTVLWQAVAGAGVPVVTILAVLVGCAEALAGNLVKVLAVLAQGSWVFDTLAFAFGVVPEGVVGLSRAVLRQAAASAEFAVPEEFGSANLW